jgi:hypothetical protein
LCPSDDDDDTSESNPPYALAPHVSTSDNATSLLGKPADEEQHASEVQSVPVLEDIRREEVPEGKQPMPSKWVFDFKTDATDTVVGHKARCVGNGFDQIEGVDYTEASSSTNKT